MIGGSSKPKPRPARSDKELALTASDVAYEVGEIFNIRQRLDFLPLLHPTFNNMAIESFLVHYRNVRDFLFPSQQTVEPEKCNYSKAIDDVIAFDFCPDGWTYISTNWTDVVPDERDRINKQLSHISYSRPGYSKDWPIPAMTEAVHMRFAEFLKALPLKRRAFFAELRPIFPRVQWQSDEQG